MSLQGFYTNKGSALAAKIAGGTTALTVTRVVAGSGHTADIPTATSLPDTEQTLTVGTAEVEGVTATLPVTLAEAQAEDDYTLTELGVYATDPDEGEVLMQVYQLSAPQEITAGGEGVLRFYLRQSIGAQGVSVVCSPAGIVLDEDLAPLCSKVMAASAPSKTVTLAADDLQDYLDALPRLVTEQLTLNISGSTSQHIVLDGFYGCGSINIYGSDAATFSDGVEISHCAIYISFKGCTIRPRNETNGACVIATYTTGMTEFNACILNGTGGITRAVGASNGGFVLVEDCEMKRHEDCVVVGRSTVVSISLSSAGMAANNSYGVVLWRGAVVMLCNAAPNTLGAAANIKNGGVIVNASGNVI